MKLNFKDLKQQKFSIDAEPSETVADVKQKVAADKGFDATAMRLIWSGKILADSNTIGSYEIKPADHIVCMVQKPKAAPVATKAPSTPASSSTAAQTPAAPAPAASSATATAPDTPSPAPATAATTETPRQPNDPSMLLGSERQAAIANMESMGFERAQCERAMRAAFYNQERAVEYLLNGIPEAAERQMAQQQQQNQQQQQQQQQQPSSGGAPPTAAPAQPQQQAVAAEPVPAGGESEEPVNLFEAAAAANQGGRGAGQGAGTGAGTGAAAGAGAGAGGAAGGQGAGNLDFMRNNPTFQQLRQLVQQQPQMLQTVLQQVSNSNPQLAQMIASQPEEFMNLLMEGSGEGDDVPLPPGAQSVSVTESERDAIERLCRLGFDRDIAIQAYFACDKNEELAANFLFENPDDDGGDQT